MPRKLCIHSRPNDSLTYLVFRRPSLFRLTISGPVSAAEELSTKDGGSSMLYCGLTIQSRPSIRGPAGDRSPKQRLKMYYWCCLQIKTLTSLAASEINPTRCFPFFAPDNRYSVDCLSPASPRGTRLKHGDIN